MATYYIDPLRGSEPGDGLSPEAPKKSIKDIAIQPGDTIRFACGRVYRESLHLVGGKVIDPVTYTTCGASTRHRGRQRENHKQPFWPRAGGIRHLFHHYQRSRSTDRAGK